MAGTNPTMEPLGTLLNYPGEDYLDGALAGWQELRALSPEAGRHAQAFLESIQGSSIEELQELFTRTFDLNPACVLEVGWQLYGDEYKRGEFLVRMRQLLAQHQAPESRELPDHLPRVLGLLPRLDREEAGALSGNFILPALGKMLASLDGKNNPYEKLLKAIREGLVTQYALQVASEEVKHA